MATTAIWSVSDRLDKVINYTTNVEKTIMKNVNQDVYSSLHRAIEYVKADFKTEEQLFVTGVNCERETAYQEMIETKKKFGKEKGILAYHAFQSFKEGEVTPEQAHEIGVKLAEELWGDKFEVLVSTHLNTKHLHNHFVLNSVSFVNGRKYRDNRRTYALMRKTSDDLCREYNLSVLEEKPCGTLKIDYSKYYNSYVQKTTYYSIVKDDVDFAIKQADTYKDFGKLLEDMGYKITIRAGKLSLCKPPYKRNIRIERSFGEEYTIKNIEDRIANTEKNNIPFPEKYSRFKKYKYKGKKKDFIKLDRGKFYKLYLYYCYLLKVFPKTENRIKLSDTMKQEIKKMEQMSDEMKFLARNKITTSKELFSYKEKIADELNKQMTLRKALRRKKEKTKIAEEKEKLYDEILSLSSKIQYLKGEVEQCKRIEERTAKMKANIKEMGQKEQERKIKERKERGKNEYSR